MYCVPLPEKERKDKEDKEQGPSWKESVWIELQKVKKQNLYSFFLGLCGISFVVAVITFSFIYWNEIQVFLGKQTATVTTLTLEDETVQIKTKHFAKDLVDELLSHYMADDETKKTTTVFVNTIITDATVKQNVIELISQILEDPRFKADVNQLALGIVSTILAEPSTTERILQLLDRLVHMPETQKLLADLVVSTLQEDSLRMEFEKVVVDVLASDQVRNQVQVESNRVIEQILTDAHIQRLAQQFVSTTLNSQAVQETAGYALWDSLKVALTPTMFRSAPVPETISTEETLQENLPLSNLEATLPSGQDLILEFDTLAIAEVPRVEDVTDELASASDDLDHSQSLDPTESGPSLAIVDSITVITANDVAEIESKPTENSPIIPPIPNDSNLHVITAKRGPRRRAIVKDGVIVLMNE